VERRQARLVSDLRSELRHTEGKGIGQSRVEDSGQRARACVLITARANCIYSLSLSTCPYYIINHPPPFLPWGRSTAPLSFDPQPLLDQLAFVGITEHYDVSVCGPSIMSLGAKARLGVVYFEVRLFLVVVGCC
jgi:hypothetical protein